MIKSNSTIVDVDCKKKYEDIYNESIKNPESFWAEMAEENVSWYKKWDNVLDYDFRKPFVKWFSGAKLNVTYNCLDRHIMTDNRNKAALICESETDSISCTYTYQQLYIKVNRMANILKKYGVKKGDRVTIYLPMIPELTISMLACARIGAIHSVVFGGFSATALGDRIKDCTAKILITTDIAIRNGKDIHYKVNTDDAMYYCPSVEKIIVVAGPYKDIKHTDMKSGRDTWWHDEIRDNTISNYCEPEWMDACDPLFILYTSGSTGKPKGIIHSTGGYLLYAHLTFKWIFNPLNSDVFFCAADIGWITGHSYIVYGPLSNGTTSIMFDGVPTHPTPDRYWDIVEKHGVNMFYTSPTAIRSLMKEGKEWVEKYNLSSLRLLGNVGEPINQKAWNWYFEIVGASNSPIADTWWQTETGGIMLSHIPGAMLLKAGSANRPFPGVKISVITEEGIKAEAEETGCLVIEKPWPGMFMGIYGDNDNSIMKEIYFSKFDNKYFSGDSAKIDKDGDFWVIGRIDDVLKVSGHRIGTAELESVLSAHESIVEVAVVGFPHELKGHGIYVFAVLKAGYYESEELKKALIKHVRTIIGPIAAPDKIQFVPGLPKTRSGKIMRRILKKIVEGDTDNLGDVSTLADPKIVDEILKNIH